MKKIILGLGLLASTTLTFAGVPTPKMIVPSAVKESFHRDYPMAANPHWKYNDGKWETSFRKIDDRSTTTACYDTKGRHIDSRMAVSQNSVPDKVIHRLNDKYPGSYNHQFTRIERPKKRELYAVKVKKQGTYKTLYIDKKGHERDYASR
ncbi:MAG: PepSY-like domain-containing protein [Bacteroidetes bacterium]|nr:PepSY-like domain-containing protein [Bacteroidota bacterium]